MFVTNFQSKILFHLLRSNQNISFTLKDRIQFGEFLNINSPANDVTTHKNVNGLTLFYTRWFKNLYLILVILIYRLISIHVRKPTFWPCKSSLNTINNDHPNGSCLILSRTLSCKTSQLNKQRLLICWRPLEALHLYFNGIPCQCTAREPPLDGTRVTDGGRGEFFWEPSGLSPALISVPQPAGFH